MFSCRIIGWPGALAAAFLAAAWAPTSRAVNIVVDYAYDTNNFFPVGGQARATLEAVASYYSGILADTFSAIAEPPDFHSSVGTGSAYFDWSLNFSHPSSTIQTQVELEHPTIAADTYRIYAGARNLGPSTLGVGGPGAYDLAWGYSGSFGPGEFAQVQQSISAFETAVKTRGETTGFSRWGGAITFNRVDTAWHFNHTTPPPAGTNDFYSVAIHEMAHALGFGASDEWSNFASGSHFAGTAAAAEYGTNPRLEPPNNEGKRGHWDKDTMNRVFGTNTPQQPSLTPSITVGTRKHLTALDAAALFDIGWTVAPPTPPTYHPADFNKDGTVNAPDLTAWRNSFGSASGADADGDNDVDGRDFLIWQRNLGATGAGASGVPEPATAALAAAFLGVLAARRRR